MSGFTTDTIDHVYRANLWTSQLKQRFDDILAGWRYVSMLSDFPDGDTWNQPSLGQAVVSDYVENSAVRYNAMDTGNFTFSITEYKQSGTYVSNKFKQDSYYISQIMAAIPREIEYALMASVEAKLLADGPNGQTASDLNVINDARHRWVASGPNDTIALEDFAFAQYALQKANMPQSNLVALVDPSVAMTINRLTNIVNVSNNPSWEGIINTGMNPTGLRFVKNVYGFDVYTSNFLKSGMSETIDGNAVTNGVANLFFSAAPGPSMPLIGAIRQPLKIESKYNMDLQREEFVTTLRYGSKLYRPENMVVVLSDKTQVYA